MPVDGREIPDSAAGIHGITLYELATRTITLEEAFMQITRNAVEYNTPTEVRR